MIDFIEVEEAEEVVECKHRTYLEFPAVYSNYNGFYANIVARELFDKRAVRISKTANYIIFRPTDLSDGYAVRKTYAHATDGRQPRILIGTERVMRDLPVKPRRWFRLYQVKDGGYAIKRNEPLEL